MRHHGWSGTDMPAPAFNYRLSDVLCALGIPQLRRLDELLESRTRIAAAYSERLAGVVDTPSADEGDVHGWQAYVVRVDRRDEVLAALRAEGIEAQIGTYALHRLGAYAGRGDFPGADAAFERALALPFHGRLEEAELERVCSALDRVVSEQ
jgi:perosamine synthetase